jgi:Fe-S-cluster containining protein
VILSAASSLAQGLDHCNRCGECCREPCSLGDGDVKRLARHFGMQPIDFARAHLDVRQRPDGVLIARPHFGQDGFCHFHREGACTVHEVKPAGGRDFECWNPRTTAPGRERMFFIALRELQQKLEARRGT